MEDIRQQKMKSMKTRFSFLELILRIPMILLMVFICIRCLIDLSHRWDTLLFILLGASGWESILFVLHRLKLLDVTKEWTYLSNIDRLNKIVDSKKSDWEEKARKRQTNRHEHKEEVESQDELWHEIVMTHSDDGFFNIEKLKSRFRIKKIR